MRKIMSILVALGVILGLTLAAAPVAAQPPCTMICTPLPITDLLAPPAFCAGQLSDYEIGSLGTPIVTPQALLSDTDKFSVDFPSDTDLSFVTVADVWIYTIASPLGVHPIAITVTNQHLEFVIPLAAFTVAVIGMGATYYLEVDNVVNPTVSATYCLYVDFCDDAICTPIQFDCGTYFVAPLNKVVGCHFDFGTTYAGIAEDYIPAFKACGDAIWGFAEPLIPGFTTNFDYIVRDENGGCVDPCPDPPGPSKFWWEVIECPAGEQIWIDDGTGPGFTADATDIGVTEFNLQPIWAGWPTAPVDVLYPMRIHFSSPGDYKLQFFIQCPAGGCPGCGGPTVVTTCVLAATAYQYKDAFKVELEDKWNLISLPLFPYDASIANVLGSMDRIDQLVSVWYFDQCDPPNEPDTGTWSTEVWTGTAFNPNIMKIQTGKAYWIRTLHLGETGYVPGLNGFWVFGTSSIMPTPAGMDMGYFDVCEGWNMVGFKAPWVAGVVGGEQDWIIGPPITGYLWNFNTGVMDTVHYGMIYEWNPVPVPGNWISSPPSTVWMNPGQGYWIPFDGDAEIYPSA